jgi:2-iminobutanoate/2-iminopropanoate deaminase
MDKTVYPLPGPLHSGSFAGKVAFSSGVKTGPGETLYISGQLGRDDNLQLIGKGDIRAQTRQVLENIKKVLERAGGTFDDIVKVTVFIKDMSQFREIHDVRLEYFHEEHLPASTMVQVSAFTLPDALIEIEAVAVLGG